MASRKQAAQARPKRASARRQQRQSGPSARAPRQRKRRSGAPAQPEHFFVVGIGASAGGLEALEAFFRNMPTDNGMAFVVVTHQPAHHTSLLPEILGKGTAMPVLQAADGMPVEPNRVYIAPPDGRLSILRDTLRILEPQPGHVRSPIDTFFRALADDQQEKAVGIVLSGTGTDGTLGLQAIKGASGMTMVQEPQSARYDGMPRSAIATGLVDYVLPPDAMPERLQAYARSPYMQARMPETTPLPGDVLDRIFLLLRAHVGHDFSLYKPTTIQRRVARRMNVHQIDDPNQYLRFLQENPHEVEQLFKELLISVTSFFRDPEAFDMLATQVLPPLLASKSDDDVVRVWVPGCATGEEAYSLGILLQEGLEQTGKRCNVQIFATDLDSQAIEVGRQGIYPVGIAADVAADRLSRFFTREETSYHVVKAIRDRVVFALHNLLSDPPFTKLDLISCRNLLIYLDATLQKRLVPMFHYALRPAGLLFLGTSETINGFDVLFATVDKRWKLFRRKEATGTMPFLGNFSLPAATSKLAGRLLETQVAPEPVARQEILIDKLLVARYAPPTVVINGRGDIVHIHGRTGAYLEPAPGQARLNLLAMAREGLRLPLSGAIRQAAAQQDEIVLERLQVKTNGATSLVRLTVQQIVAPEALHSMLRVSFEPVAEAASPPPPHPRGGRRTSKKSREAELEQELRTSQEELQHTREELDAAKEEFQSASEEMQSTNEEFQSTNEELESAKEELQSLNEELQTVNAELQSKVEMLSSTNDDMDNLLNSTDIATVFLDNHLCIKRFTPKSNELFRLIQSDIGRPLSDLTSSLNHERLVQDAEAVLRTLDSKDREVQTKTDTWYLMRMRPYRTARNVIDGVVVTFVDITRLKQAEAARQAAEAAARRYAENIVQAIRQPLVILDAELQVVSANQSFYQLFALTPETTTDRYLYEVGQGQWNLPELRQQLSNILPHDTGFESVEITYEVPHRGRRLIRLNAHRMQQPGETDLILLAFEDVTPARQDSAS